MKVEKYLLDGLTGEELKSAQNFNALVDKIEAMEQSNEVASIKSEIASLKESMPKDNIDKITELENALKEQGRLITNQSKITSDEQKTLKQAIVEAIESLGVKSMPELIAYAKKEKNFELTIKADVPTNTTANSDYIGRTNLDAIVRFAPSMKLAFIGSIRRIQEDGSSSRFGYTEGSYTSNAAYVGEGSENPTNDSATASAKFREYAKISAYLHMNAEVQEDIPSFASQLVAKLQFGVLSYLDKEIIDGDGELVDDVQHIHGMWKDATAFNSALFEDSVESANSADLVSAMSTQIDVENGEYMASHVAIHPIDYFKLTSLKDKQGQPLITKDVNGVPKLAGLTVIKTKRIGQNKLLVWDQDVVELHVKREMTLQMGQILTDDVKKNRQSAIIFARYQTLIRDLDKVAVVKCEDVAAALEVINKPAVVAGE